MLGSRRHPAHGWDQSVFVLLSVLALLAFALFPVAASADSAGYEYETAVPSPTGGAHKAPTVVGGNEEGDKAHASTNGGSTGGGGGSGSGSGGGSSEGGNAGRPAGQGSGQHNGGNGSTTSQHPNGGKDAGGVESLQQVSSPTNGSEDDGGSSPVVPILIAVALLAAISVGVVVWQRRRSDTSPATPKAG
jgi:cobalamin biosynthesis Mg chelatase CobN